MRVGSGSIVAQPRGVADEPGSCTPSLGVSVTTVLGSSPAQAETAKTVKSAPTSSFERDMSPPMWVTVTWAFWDCFVPQRISRSGVHPHCGRLVHQPRDRKDLVAEPAVGCDHRI